MAGSGAKAIGKALGKDRVGDYKAVQSQLDAIRANLRTTGAGISGALTASQARTLGSIQQIAAKGMQKSTGALASATDQIRNRYGTALGGITAPLLAPAAAASKATGLGATAAVKAAGTAAKGGQLALGIEQTGAKTARQGAEYVLNQALMYRAQQDATLVAQQKSQWALYKKEHDYAIKQAGIAADAKGAAELTTVLNEGSSFAVALGTYMTAHPGTTPAAAVTAVMTSTGIGVVGNGVDPAAVQYFTSMANAIKGGMTPGEAAQNAWGSTFSSYAGFGQVNASTVGAGVTATMSQTAASDLKAAVTASSETANMVDPTAYHTMITQGYTDSQIIAAAAVLGIYFKPSTMTYGRDDANGI